MVAQQKKILVDEAYGWHNIHFVEGSIYWHGFLQYYDQIVNLVLKQKKLSERIIEFLRSEYSCFGIIIDHPEFIFASVDRVRSYPIYYCNYNNRIIVSNCANVLRDHCQIQKLNPQSLLEFNMSGYVYNKRTLYQTLHQLQSGEYLFWKRELNNIDIKRYYQYIPRPKQSESAADLQNDLSRVINNVMNRTIERAAGAPIWVPLSGGLDSRLILSKLVEFKYDHLHAFSFGVAGNFEAKRAKYVAEKLGVPWLFCPFKSKYIQNPDYLNVRNSYTNFSAGLCTAPAYLGFEAFYTLTRNNKIPSNAVIVNGQSGDFITGGHVPRFLYHDATKFDQIIEALITKHCSLWLNLKTPKNLELTIKNITDQLPVLDNLPQLDRFYSNYETWEWQERQSKAVVNGQRIYDFFKLKWLLPLWDSEFIDFWETVSYELKINQKLYIDYLKNYNYKGVFSILRDEANPWTLKYLWIPWVARCIGLLVGKDCKAKYYRNMYYYATDHDQYAYYGRKYYLQYYKIARSVASFDVKNYLNMNCFNDNELLKKIKAL